MKLLQQPILILCIYFLFQFIGFCFFTSGFFIIREQLFDRNINNNLQKQTQKVVFLVIDAMRFDFAFSENNFESNYLNQFPIIRQKLHDQPLNSLLFKSYADPPTVTMQRIKAFVTGNLQSFIDLKNNFFAEILIEDNLIYQINQQNLNSIFMGDDTWVRLFPNSFHEAYPFDSFNVGDLDTVDNGVIANLFTTIQKNEFNLLIGHFLGVDHVGHTYDSNDIHMKIKLQQLNKIVEQVIDVIAEGTVLVVVSDHGMTQDGNHGGGSLNETETIIFGYVKNTQGFVDLGNNLKRIQRFDPKYLNTVDQIDIVPTIAMLLGLNIPFNNLGILIHDFMILQGSEREVLDEVYQAYLQNMQQVLNYVEKMQQNYQKFPQQVITKWQQERIFIEGKSDKIEVIQLVSLFLKEIRQYCRQIWNEFDISLIVVGLLVLSLCTFMLFFEFVRFLDFSIQNRIFLIPLTVFWCDWRLLGIAGLIAGTLAIAQVRIVIILGGLIVVLIIGLRIKLNQFNYSYFKLKSSPFGQDQPFVCMFMGVQYFRGYMMFSVGALRTEEQYILGTLIVLLLGYFAIIMQKQEQNRVNQSLNLLKILLVLIIAAHFDTSNLKKYNENALRLKIIEEWGQTLLFRVVIPSAGLLWIINRIFRNAPSNRSQQMLQILFIINMLVSVVYQVFQEEQSSKWVTTILPRTIYSISILSTFLITMTKNPNIFKLICWLVAILPISIILIGRNSIPLILAYLVVLIAYLRLVKSLEREQNMHVWSFLALLSSYFWFITGHRCQLSAIQVQTGYIGFEEFDIYRSSLLIIFNTFSSHIFTLLLIPVMQEYLENDNESFLEGMLRCRRNDFHRSQMKKYRLTLNSMYIQQQFLITLTCTAMMCSVHLRALLLIEDFAPKYLFEGVTFCLVNVILLIINLINYFFIQ